MQLEKEPVPDLTNFSVWSTFKWIWDNRDTHLTSSMNNGISQMMVLSILTILFLVVHYPTEVYYNWEDPLLKADTPMEVNAEATLRRLKY